jgi:adenylate kinase family enzyme
MFVVASSIVAPIVAAQSVAATMNLTRTVIIGNSGSGKSTLAGHVAAIVGCEVVNLDTIYWIDQLKLVKRGAVAAKAMVVERADADRWVIEGVYGWLIDLIAARATHLIWLDLPWSECEAGLRARGSMGVDAAEFQGLLDWARDYRVRQTPSSHTGHATIYSAFTGPKCILVSRTEVATFAARLAVVPRNVPFGGACHE